MSVKVINGDLFNSKAQIICHQVNCKGKMGSGVALQVKRKFPHVYEEYLKQCSDDKLGKIQLVPIHKESLKYLPGDVFIPVNNEQYICNMFAQSDYGNDGKQYTSMEALCKCFISVRQCTWLKNSLFNATIAMPWKIGCVRGGANWDVVLNMIQSVFKNNDVELWRL